MTTDVLDSLGKLEQLQPEWCGLYHSCSRATPFQSPQWLLPWARRLYKGGDIWVISIRDRGQLIGLAPLFCWGIERKTVSFLGAGISDYADLLGKRGREEECADAMWAALEDRRDQWDVLDLRELPASSILLPGQASEPCAVCPVLDFANYPDVMDHKHRTDVRRARNKLAKSHSIEFAMACQQTLAQIFDEFLGLYEARWGAMSGELKSFHREVVAGFLAAGMLRLCVLRIDGTPAASIYAFTDSQALYCYLSGFQPEFGKLSPGAVLLSWLIDRAREGGIGELDFLRQPECYKYLWGARDRVNFAIHLS